MHHRHYVPEVPKLRPPSLCPQRPRPLRQPRPRARLWRNLRLSLPRGSGLRGWQRPQTTPRLYSEKRVGRQRVVNGNGWVVNGNGWVVNGKRFVLEPQETLYVPRETQHAVLENSTDKLSLTINIEH